MFKKILTPPNSLLKKIQTQKKELIFQFLSQNFKDFIQKYQKKSDFPYTNTKKIRTCRRQGTHHIPEIVKHCLESVKQHQEEYELIIIDQNNYSQYLDLPPFILEKVKNKEITLTHLSDIIRMGLLKQYGGIWVDATMFFTKNFIQAFNNINLNSNYPQKHIEKNYEFTKRTGFFIGGKSNKTFSFVYDFFLEYHKQYHQLIDFFLIDYALLLAYHYFPESKTDIDHITLKNEDIFQLVTIFNLPYEKKQYEKIMQQGFFKLTYKIDFFEYTKNNELTNYGKFIKDFIKGE